MLNIVSNTTPLISLLKLSKLDILKVLYGRINIPNAVFQEVEAGKNKDYYKDLSNLDWINIVENQDKQAVKYFLDLDSVEAEAIILATEIKADLIIMDEKLGRFHAKHADIKVTGTIGVLIKAKKEGLIKELKPLLYELIRKEVWICDKLINEILNKLERINFEYQHIVKSLGFQKF
jgi:predicted nucleic acid-binding protein